MYNYAMKNILVVFNDISGRKKAVSNLRLIYKSFKKSNVNFKFIFAKVLPLIKDISKYDSIVVVGGDGTINSVLSYLVNSDKTLGIIPMGTANLLSANLGIPQKISEALKIILQGKTKKIDCALANDRYFILRLGFGYDADILKDTSQTFKQNAGYFAYFIQGAIKAFIRQKASYKVKLDDEKIFVSAGSIIIANAANMFKNIFTVAPDGTVDDGKLDVVIRRSGNFFEFAIAFLGVIFNQQKQVPKIICRKASRIVIKTKNKKFHIDGELIKFKDELEIQVVPKSVNVFIP